MRDLKIINEFCAYLDRKGPSTTYKKVVGWIQEGFNFYSYKLKQVNLLATESLRKIVEPLVSEALWKTLCISKTFRGESSLETFVWGVTLKKMLDVRKSEISYLKHYNDVYYEEHSENDDDSQNRSSAIFQDKESLNPHGELELRENVLMIEQVMREFSQQDQELLNYALIDKLPREEIAKKMGMSIPNVKTSISRKRRKIKERIKEIFDVTI
jgi:RNA polymerase sigma factor (sigma-70 family)